MKSSRFEHPRRYSCEEVHKRMHNGLCLFCDELDTPGHYQSKHKRSQIFRIEVDDDDQICAENELGYVALHRKEDHAKSIAEEKLTLPLGKNMEHLLGTEIKHTLTDRNISGMASRVQPRLLQPPDPPDFYPANPFSVNLDPFIKTSEPIQILQGSVTSEQEEDRVKNVGKYYLSLPKEYKAGSCTLIKQSNDIQLSFSQEYFDSHRSTLSSLEMVQFVSGRNCSAKKRFICVSLGDRVWEPGGFSSKLEPQTYHADDDMLELKSKLQRTCLQRNTNAGHRLQHKQSQVFKKGCVDELMYDGDESMPDTIPQKLGPLLKFLRLLSGDTSIWKNIQSSYKCDDFLWRFHWYTLSTETRTLPLDCCDLVLGVLFIYEVAENLEKLAKTWKFKASSEKIRLVDAIFSFMEEPSGEVNTELDAKSMLKRSLSSRGSDYNGCVLLEMILLGIVRCKELGKKLIVGGQKMETKDKTPPVKLHVPTTTILSVCSEAGIRFDYGSEERNSREILMNHEAANQMAEDSGDAQMEVKTVVLATIVQEKPMKVIVLLLAAPSTLCWSCDMYISSETSIEELNPVRLKLELPFFVISKIIGLLSSLEENTTDIIKLSKQTDEAEVRVKEHQNEVNFYIGVETSQNLCAIMKLDCMDKIVDTMPRREELLRISGRKQKWSKSFMDWFDHKLDVVVRYGEYDWLETYVCDETMKTRNACDGNKMATIICLGVMQLSWVLDLEKNSLLLIEMKRDANMFFVGNEQEIGLKTWIGKLVSNLSLASKVWEPGGLTSGYARYEIPVSDLKMVKEKGSLTFPWELLVQATSRFKMLRIGPKMTDEQMEAKEILLDKHLEKLEEQRKIAVSYMQESSKLKITESTYADFHIHEVFHLQRPPERYLLVILEDKDFSKGEVLLQEIVNRSQFHFGLSLFQFMLTGWLTCWFVRTLFVRLLPF